MDMNSLRLAEAVGSRHALLVCTHPQFFQTMLLSQDARMQAALRECHSAGLRLCELQDSIVSSNSHIIYSFPFLFLR